MWQLVNNKIAKSIKCFISEKLELDAKSVDSVLSILLQQIEKQFTITNNTLRG